MIWSPPHRFVLSSKIAAGDPPSAVVQLALYPRDVQARRSGASEAKGPESRADGERTQGKTPARPAKTTAAADGDRPEPPADPEASYDGKTIYVGNIKVHSDGKVETREHVIDENGITPKVRPIPRIGPDGLPDPRYLTPAQRRKLQELRRRGLLPPLPARSPYPQNKY